MSLNFNQFAAKGNEFLKELARELGYPDDMERAGRVLKSVLHALRNQLTVQESVQLLAQLPMALKAVYVDNWTLHRTSKKAKHIEDFFREIRKIDKQTAQFDFHTDDDIDRAIAVVFLVLRNHLSLGELEDIKAVLPKDLKYMVSNVSMI